jgi:hypothetical protein
MGNDSGGDGAAPGWDAISAELDRLYPGQEPKHYGTVIPYSLGGPDPIQGISVYEAAGPDHWHYVTYGFSELYEKETDEPATSGYGFELTLRLARHEPEPPFYPLSFLQNLARYVFSTGCTFASGHHMDLNGPIEVDSSSAITAICFARDPELPPLATPNSRLQFLQIVGLTEDELVAVKVWNTVRFLDLLAERSPKLVTDARRSSFLADPAFAQRVAEGTARDGSSMDVLFVDKLELDAPEQGGQGGQGRAILRMGANQVSTVAQVLPSRLRHGRALTIQGPAVSVLFEPAEESPVTIEDRAARVRLTQAALAELVRAWRPERGRRELRELPRLAIEVVPTEIKDQEGNVLRVIG